MCALSPSCRLISLLLRHGPRFEFAIACKGLPVTFLHGPSNLSLDPTERPCRLRFLDRLRLHTRIEFNLATSTPYGHAKDPPPPLHGRPRDVRRYTFPPTRRGPIKGDENSRPTCKQAARGPRATIWNIARQLAIFCTKRSSLFAPS